LTLTRQTATPFVDSRCFLGEGIVWWAARRALLWTDIEGARFWMHDAGGTRNWTLPKRLASFTPSRSGGLLFALEDGLFRADFDPAAPEGLRLAHLADIEPDLPTTRANDGRADRSGNFVFGTMNQARGNAPIGSFYQWSTRSGLRRLDLPNIGIANSICFSPDGGTMYFCDTPQAKIMACDYDADSAAVSNVREFTVLGPGQGHPDGSIIDAEGHLWSAVWGGAAARRHRPDGTIEREVAVPARNVTCLAFGGPDLSELFITTARQDMSPADMERVPETGGVYRAVPDGVRGLQDTLFAD
jgi:L-arabinonolactonase